MYSTNTKPSTPPSSSTTSSSATATCCPTFARFEGTRRKTITVNSVKKPAYYAFDDRTNIRPGASAGVYPAASQEGYWNTIPVGSHPGTRTTRDGAPWVSVPVGEVTQVEIHMDPNALSCIANATFISDNPSRVSVLTSKVTSKKADFNIQGRGRGEATIVARCDGKDVGWFHVWCDRVVTLNLDCIQARYGTGSPTLAVNQTTMANGLNDAFRQALIQFNVTWVPVTISAATLALETTARAASAAIGRPATDLHFPSGAALRTYMQSIIPAASRTSPRNGYLFHVPQGSAAVTVPANGAPATSFAGVVAPLNSRRGWSYVSRASTFWHEVGHMLGLGHPMQTSHGLPGHLTGSLNLAVPARSKTNTDAAIPAEVAGRNVMALDPQNIMGYSRNRNNRDKLRYGQWKACRRS